MPKQCDSDVDMDPQGSHQTADRTHDAKDRHVPGIVEHTRAI